MSKTASWADRFGELMREELVVLGVQLMKILGRIIGGAVVKRAERYGLVSTLSQDLYGLAR